MTFADSLRTLFLGASLFLSFLSFAPLAKAWGCKGHQTVALIAEKHLTPEAKEFVEAILKAHPVDPSVKRWCGNQTTDLMVDASTWADDVRAQYKNGPQHYIDIPRLAKKSDTPSLQPFCEPDGCVTEAITARMAILKDASADAAKRADALRFLIHFVGDLHQPLHGVDNNDHGGNCLPVQFFRVAPRLNTRHPGDHDYSPNLHSVWDSAIVERDMEVGDPFRYADDLEAAFQSQFAAWEKAGIKVDDWAWESHDSANQVAYGRLSPGVEAEAPVKTKTCADDHDVAGRMLSKHIVLDEKYQSVGAPVVRQRIAEAGIRLAMILNEIAKS